MRLLLDTNVLLLWLVGLVNPAAIGKKRLKNFDATDFLLVKEWAAQTDRHISTPHVLSEVSNFLDSGERELVRGGIDQFKEYVSRLEEIHQPAKDVVWTAEFDQLGLTDTAILHLARSDTRVISVDFHLCNRLAAKGVEALNPYNFRLQ